MSAVSCAARPVLSGRIVFGAWGAWTAELELDAPTAPVGAVEVTWRSSVLSGWVRDGGTFAGRTRVQVVGGRGQLHVPLTQRHYAGPLPARLVVEDIVADAGEVLAPEAVAALELLELDRWVRPAGTAIEALGALAKDLEISWRMKSDGTLWLGVDTFPPVAEVPFVVSDDPRRKVLDVAPTRGFTLLPGQTILGRQATRVVYHLDGQIRAEVGYGPQQRDDVGGAIASLLPPRVYREIYGATVVAQRADGSLDVTCDDDRMGMLTGVPVRVGIPGARVVVDPGARVRVHFESGSPRKFYAIGFDAETDSGAAPAGVARVGDEVDLGWWAVVPSGGGYELQAAVEGAPGAAHLTGSVSSGSSKILLPGGG